MTQRYTRSHIHIDFNYPIEIPTFTFDKIDIQLAIPLIMALMFELFIQVKEHFIIFSVFLIEYMMKFTSDFDHINAMRQKQMNDRVWNMKKKKEEENHRNVSTFSQMNNNMRASEWATDLLSQRWKKIPLIGSYEAIPKILVRFQMLEFCELSQT